MAMALEIVHVFITFGLILGLYYSWLTPSDLAEEDSRRGEDNEQDHKKGEDNAMVENNAQLLNVLKRALRDNKLLYLGESRRLQAEVAGLRLQMIKLETSLSATVAELNELKIKVSDDINQITRSVDELWELSECNNVTVCRQLTNLQGKVSELNGIVDVLKLHTKYTNLAKSKSSSQSSTYGSGGASWAVDGNTNQNYNAYSCTHTNTEHQPWWMVDLGAIYHVQRVVLYNRGDCCGERLRNFNVTLSNDRGGKENVVFFHYGGQSHSGEVLTLGNPRRPLGRYLKLQLLDTGILSLCEVQVFSF